MNGAICIRLVGRYPTIGLTSHLTESGRMGSGMCKHAFEDRRRLWICQTEVVRQLVYNDVPSAICFRRRYR